MNALLKDLRQSEAVESCFAFGEYLHVTLKSDVDMQESFISRYAGEKGHTTVEVHAIKPTIEDSFIRLTETARN